MKTQYMLGLILVAGSSWAADMPDSRDLPQLPRYPQSQIVDYKQTDVVGRVYPKSSLQRIGGRLRMEAQVSASGELTAITYLLSDTHSATDAFAQAKHALLQQEAELLFWCEGRDCGSSSLWANSIFERSLLYGPESQQAYLLARFPGSPDSLVVLYGITRGNGRSYLQVEQLVPADALGELLPTPATLLRLLKDTGKLNLSRWPDSPLDPWTQLLVRTLQQDSTLQVSIGGRDAVAWREALVAKGVRVTHLELENSGSPGVYVTLLR